MKRHHKSTFLAIGLFLALSVSISAAPGDLDPTFGSGGKVITGGNFPNHLWSITDIAIQPDGKIVAVGKSYKGNYDFALRRYNSNGSVDQTFNGGQLVTTDFGFNESPRAVAIQPDGKIVAAGEAVDYQPFGTYFYHFALARYQGGSNLRTRFDFDGDGRADLATFLAADGMWSIRNSTNNQTVWTNFGLSEDKTVAPDYDGDLKTDVAVFRPSNGMWYVKESTNPNPNAFREVRWGTGGDKPVTGDFDGDGRADFAVWRPSSADWWILNSADGAASVVNFGSAGDVPLSHADFDGDRRADIAVRRGSEWHILNSALDSHSVQIFGNADARAAASFLIQ